MPASHRTIALALALSTIIACEDPFTNGHPGDSPGIIVPGLGNHLCVGGPGCSAWSADSKTLYVVAGAGGPGPASLMAVDLATLTSRVVGQVDGLSLQLTPTADGTAIYFEAIETKPVVALLIKRMSLSDGSITTIARNGGGD